MAEMSPTGRSRPPHASAAAGGNKQGRQPIVHNGQVYVPRETLPAVARQAQPKKSSKSQLLILVLAIIVLWEMAAPEKFAPSSLAGNARMRLLVPVREMETKYEICKSVAMSQIKLGQDAAHRRFNIEMQAWEQRMREAGSRYAREKSDAAGYTGMCGLLAFFGLDGLCGGAVRQRYDPSQEILEREIEQIRQQRPQLPETLQQSYAEEYQICLKRMG